MISNTPRAPGATRITLKTSAYALQDPETGLHIALCRTRPALKPAPFGTLFHTAEQDIHCAGRFIPGVACELVRIDRVAA